VCRLFQGFRKELPRARADNHAPQAVTCIDPFHVAKLGGEALDEIRREYWNELRALGDKDAAKRFKDARWALLKRPEISPTVRL